MEPGLLLSGTVYACPVQGYGFDLQQRGDRDGETERKKRTMYLTLPKGQVFPTFGPLHKWQGNPDAERAHF